MRMLSTFLVALSVGLGATPAHADFATAFDRDSVEEYWRHRWTGKPDPTCGALMAFAARLFGRRAPQIASPPRRVSTAPAIAPMLLSEPYALKSKSQSNRAENRGKLFQLLGRAEGVLINGKDVPQANLILLPQSKVPVAVINPTAPPKGRIILLHGLGYSISTVFSVVGTGLQLHAIGEGGLADPFAQWFAAQYRNLAHPYQIVLIDVPPMGWAPPLDTLPTAASMAEYLRGLVEELDAMQKLDNHWVTRSASAPLGVLAGRHSASVTLTGGTFPSRRTLAANTREVRRLEQEEGETPDWTIINAMLERFGAPEFLRQLETVARSRVPVRSLVGGDDLETPWSAQWEWVNLLGLGSDPVRRSQHIIRGAGHQVFRRPNGLSPTEFSVSDPDVTALRLLLEFLDAVSH